MVVETILKMSSYPVIKIQKGQNQKVNKKKAELYYF